MNKWITIGLSIAISAFLGANAILLFSDKSNITKAFYVHEYERLGTTDFEEELPKESLVAPLHMTTVYLKDEDTIQNWLVKEGDVVMAGQELATLNTSTADEQRTLWQSEQGALTSQVTDINKTIRTLKSDRVSANNANNSNENSTDNISEENEEQTLNVGINVDVGVDVQQDGAFAQAIAQAEQKLAEVNQKMIVVDAQLDQEGAAAVISPVEGVVSAIQDKNNSLAIEIYSNEKIIITYGTDEQWQDLALNDRVHLQAGGMTQPIEGTIIEISQVPAKDSKLLTAYKALDPKKHTNPLAYYEVRIQPGEPIDNLPFGNNTNAFVVVNEAQQAVSLKTSWLFNRFEQTADAYVVNSDGYLVKTPVTLQFDWKTRSVISEGLEAGSVVVYEPQVTNYRYAPSIFFPMPMDPPAWQSVKETDWKFYLKHLLF